jgi:predicted amidohydrolase
MTLRFHVVAAQIKPKKADYTWNLGRIADIFAQIDKMSPRPDVLVLPETVMSGYFLEGGVRDVARSRKELFADLLRLYRERTRTPQVALDIALGCYELWEGKYYNAALYATLTTEEDGPHVAGIRHVHHKFFLPTYGVFDEKRFVSRGRSVHAFDTRFGRVAVLICEDVWHSITPTLAALDGAQVIYILSASPGREFGGQQIGNLERWKRLLPSIADEHNVFVVYAGLVGFEGGKGFTGSSCVVDPWGQTVVIGPETEECLVQASIDLEDVATARFGSPMLADLEANLTDIVLQLDAIARRPQQAGQIAPAQLLPQKQGRGGRENLP